MKARGQMTRTNVPNVSAKLATNGGLTRFHSGLCFGQTRTWVRPRAPQASLKPEPPARPRFSVGAMGDT